MAHCVVEVCAHNTPVTRRCVGIVLIAASSSARYLLLDGSSPGRVAVLTSPLLDPNSYCLRIRYHMYGADQGTLRLVTNLQGTGYSGEGCKVQGPTGWGHKVQGPTGSGHKVQEPTGHKVQGPTQLGHKAQDLTRQGLWVDLCTLCFSW